VRLAPFAVRAILAITIFSAGSLAHAEGSSQGSAQETKSDHAESLIPCDTDALITAIDSANIVGSGSLSLTPGCTYAPIRAQPDTNDGMPPITARITINGNGAIIARSTDPNTPEFRIFEVPSSRGALTLNNLTITNGAASSDDGGGSGGGVFVHDGGTLSANNISVAQNTASGGTTPPNPNGGGIANKRGTVTLTNSQITENTAADGAGVSNDNGGSVKLVNSTVANNTADSPIASGGGILNSFDGATVNLESSRITGNRAGLQGGGIFSISTLKVTNSIIANNTVGPSEFVGTKGGGVTGFGTMTLANSTVDGNRAENGRAGGIRAEPGADLTLINSRVAHNIATDPPGGIDNNAATVQLRNTVVADNTPSNCTGSLSPVSGCTG
jgi:hypothetical protein